MTAPFRLAVTELRLAHFRSYELCAVETDGASVVLFGPNGAGKTNILEAVSLLVPGRGLRRASADEMVRRGGPGWRIRAEVATPDGAVEIVTGVEGTETARRTVEIDGKAATQTALGRYVRMVWLTPAMDRLWAEAAGERRRFLDRIALGFEPDHAEAAVAYEKAMRARNRLLREPPWDDAWLAGLEAQMARAGARIARARAEALARLQAAQNILAEGRERLFPRAKMTILGEMEARFSEALCAGPDVDSDADSELDSLEGVEAAALARTLGESRSRDSAAGRTLTGPHLSDLEAIYAVKGMPAAACSTGEQKALLISVALANARALAEATGAAPILLLDEVAAHLDASRRKALFDEIEALGAQAWMTGTGPELFEGVAPATLCLAVSETDGRSALAEG